MKVRPALTLLFVLVLCVAAGGRAAAAVPPAPTPLAPAFGANVLVPFTISWSAVSDPSGIVAYNWQVSSSSTFTPVILQNSTNGATQDIVSGLANGTYFWRVQAVNGAFVQGAWSPAQSFIVTGAGAGAPHPFPFFLHNPPPAAAAEGVSRQWHDGDAAGHAHVDGGPQSAAEWV